MQPRLKRYKQFIEKEFISRLTRNKEYSLNLKKELEDKIRNNQFSRILFTGMGCSAIVSDIIKGFFADQKIPIHVEVINDYEIDFLVNKEILQDGKTLVIISSYSGFSQEPINAYEKIKEYTKDIIFLTSGGKLEQIAKKENVSLIYWKIVNPDREYPLFYAPQYFVILLDVFHKLGMIRSNYESELKKAAEAIKKEFTKNKIKEAEKVAKNLRNKDIILLASPKWYLTLLKLVKMHINEIAMAPAHRNFIHEFTHSEIAILTNPKSKQALLIFRDKNEDNYTKNKIDNFIKILTEKVPENKNITVQEIKINQKDFFQQFFSTLLFIQYITYFLGVYYNYKSRELISRAAQNPWYNIKTIKKELGSKSKDYYDDRS
jgi:glucose/mannose-6-phosphate isomerase